MTTLRKNPLLALSAFTCLGLSTANNASTFQYEIGIDASQTRISNPIGPDVTPTQTRSQLTYYIQPVAASRGPFSERVFLSKVDSVSGSFSQSNLAPGPTFESMALDARFVTQSDYVFEFAFDRSDPLNRLSSGSGRQEYSIGLGKYLGDRSTAMLSLRTEEGAINSSTFEGRYRRLSDFSSSGRYTAFTAALAYIDTDETNFDEDLSAYRLSLQGSYYLSERLSFGASLSHLTSGEGKTSALIQGEYHFTSNVLGRFHIAGTPDDADLRIDSLGLGFIVRF